MGPHPPAAFPRLTQMQIPSWHRDSGEAEEKHHMDIGADKSVLPHHESIPRKAKPDPRPAAVPARRIQAVTPSSTANPPATATPSTENVHGLLQRHGAIIGGREMKSAGDIGR